MKAVILDTRGADGAHYKDHEKPTPKEGEALVKLEAASLISQPLGALKHCFPH